jgi:uncharacterized repeat protein (TIGR01451 family)
MNENVVREQPKRRYSGVFFSMLLAALMILTVFQTIIAQEGREMPADLSGSTKAVNNSTATPGSLLQYTIVLSNSGDLPAAGVKLTDTLVTGLTYNPGSLSVNGGGLFGEDNGVITWTGSVNNSAEIILTFKAVLDNGLDGGELITNTAEINYNSATIERTVVTTIITDSAAFLPIVYRSVPVPTLQLNGIGRPNANNAWTVSWSVSNETYIDSYQLQEANHPSFTNPTTIDVPVGTTSILRAKALSINNLYYYRVRAVGDFGITDWSNIQQVRGGYRDDFNDPASGWEMRRQDTDTVINDSFYRDGHFVLEMDSSYDYQIGGPMSPGPAVPYAIESQIRLVGVDNLHSYGLIFGGDWNGQECPNDDYSSCFNVYYRLNVIWSGNLDNQLTIQLKRIDFHDGNNVGRGPDLIPAKTVNVNSPAEGYQIWRVFVYADGLIQITVNNNLVGEVYDTMYINNPYFAAFSSTDEYNGLEAEFDYYQVSFLNP